MRDYWEFPGGKIRRDESAQDALRRELGEELGIEVCDCEFLQKLEHDYPEMRVEIDFFLVSRWQGMPTGLEGQALKWLQPVNLSAEILLPADVPLVELLKDMQERL